MDEIERYKLIKKSFKGNINFDDKKIKLNQQNINLLDSRIPDFINHALDPLTSKISKFYNDVKFPEYDDCEDYASLYEKGTKNNFTNRLDKELDYGIKICELGCGTGQLSLFLARGNREVFALDISDNSLLIGEKFRKKNEINNAYFMKMDVFNLKFKKNYFDCTISNGVLHHTKDAKKAFQKLVEVTKPGGYIVIGLYHKYGRFFTKLKQLLAKLIRKKIFILDRTALKIKGKEKRNAWIKDQFFNPHETLHTPMEILEWFQEENIDFINLLPHYDEPNVEIFKKRPTASLSLIKEIFMAFNPTQILEGGFFIMIGKKK